MLPGRELDELIANKIFGLDVIFGGIDGYKFKPNEIYHTDLPHYSTDIKAAWLVVEKMQASDYKLILEGLKEPGFTAPQAICLAGLKALGHQIPNATYEVAHHRV